MACTLGGTKYNYAAAAGSSLASGALSADPSVGDTVLVGITYTQDASETVSSVTDNASGNTYSYVTGTRQTTSTGRACEIWSCILTGTTTSFSVTMTMTTANCTTRSIMVAVVQGAASSSSIDLAGGQTQDAPGSGTNAILSGALGTPSTDGQFVFAVTMNDGGPDDINNGTGYTEFHTYNFGDQCHQEYLIQSTAAAVNASFTTDSTGGSAKWATAAVTVKAATAGSPAPIFFGRRR